VGSIIVGVLLLITGTALVAAGLFLAIAEIISGRHRKGGPIAQQYAGLDWTGLTGLINAIAKVLEGLKDWKMPALLILFGLLFDIFGVVVLAARWF
jgi:hypothetical protein